MNVRIAFPSGETIFFSVSFAIPRHVLILENKADTLEKETSHGIAPSALSMWSVSVNFFFKQNLLAFRGEVLYNSTCR